MEHLVSELTKFYNVTFVFDQFVFVFGPMLSGIDYENDPEAVEKQAETEFHSTLKSQIHQTLGEMNMPDAFYTTVLDVFSNWNDIQVEVA